MSPNYSGFALASFAIAVSPGASWLYVITSTVASGRIGGFLAVAGNALGILVHVAAAVFGLTAMLRYSPNVFAVFKLAGAAYLIYLAVRTVRQASIAPQAETDSDGSAISAWPIFRGGILVNATNPKAALLMLALLPQFVDMSAGNVTLHILGCGLIHILVASSVLSVLVLTANTVRDSLRSSSKLDRIFRWTSAVILFVLGLKLATVMPPV